MKIAMFSINPIFPDVVTGGASKHLYHIARYLGTKGHQVEIYCARGEEAQQQFYWADNVLVEPVLPFKLPFPQPYAVSGADLAVITGRLWEGIRDADRFYIHDGEWLVPDVYRAVPTVTSFRDNIYPESVLGTFLTKADDLICVSSFSAAVIQATAGRFFPEFKNRMHQVNNGIDFDQFSPQDVSAIARELDVDPELDIIILHPHRPEPGKGLHETVRVVSRLVHQHGLDNLKVLVPEWIWGMVSLGETTFYHQMLRAMQDLGVRDHFQFIPWLPNQRMPELYSLGAVTLCLGRIVEAFGNVAYESLACGTPSVVARVGVHRTLMPEQLMDKVHPGDTEGAVQSVLTILNRRPGVNKETSTYLHQNLDFDAQVSAYAAVIEGCSKREPLVFQPQIAQENQPYRLAPWCYIHENQIYHDFKGAFEPVPNLVRLIQEQEIFSYETARKTGLSDCEWQDWLAHTWIVPKW